MTKEELIKEMNDILAELSDMNNETITDENYGKYYEEAADELNYDEEDEDGELDIFRFNFDRCETYCDLKHELRELMAAGMGGKKVVVADDNDGNSFHGIYYSCTSDPKEVKGNIEISNGLYDSLTNDYNDIVIIG